MNRSKTVIAPITLIGVAHLCEANAALRGAVDAGPCRRYAARGGRFTQCHLFAGMTSASSPNRFLKAIVMCCCEEKPHATAIAEMGHVGFHQQLAGVLKATLDDELMHGSPCALLKLFAGG